MGLPQQMGKPHLTYKEWGCNIMGMLEDMMMKTQGQQSRPPQPMGPSQQGIPDPYAPPASQFAGGMDPQMLQQVAQMMQATQGQKTYGQPNAGMPPRPAGKTVRPPSPSANSNIRSMGSSTYDQMGRAANSAAQQADDPDFGTSGGKYPYSHSWENPQSQNLNRIRQESTARPAPGGYDQSGPINSRTPAGGALDRSGVPIERQMELAQNGFFDMGGVRYFLNDYGELESTNSPGYNNSAGYQNQGR